jgi:uncharacterized protein with HEPN domain
MQLESKKWLSDMPQAANLIADFIEDKTVKDFCNDQMLRSGVYYQFLIVGED